MLTLVCTNDDFPIEGQLTVGKEYEVVEEYDGCYTIIGNKGYPLHFTMKPDANGLSFATWFTLEDKTVEDVVTISKTEYDKLIDDSEKLSCLEACGVDNWQGYDDAMQMYHESVEQT